MERNDRTHATNRDDSKESDSTYSRRNILKATGGLGALAIVPSAVAADDGVSVKEAGIAEEFNQLIKSGKTDQAFALLEEHRVNYTKVTESPSSDEGNVSTQDYYEVGNSSVTFYTSEWDASNDEYAIGLSWTLESQWGDVDGPAPVDVPALAFENDVFGYVDDSATASGTLQDFDGSPSESGITTIVSEPGSADPDAPSNALVAEFDDGRLGPDFDDDPAQDVYPVGQGVIQIVIRKQNTSTQGIVAGLYTHTWSIYNFGELPILENFAVSIPGPGISVSVPTGVDKWELPNSDDRDQSL